MAKDLTVAAIEKLKPKEKRYEQPDGHTRGLYLVVQPSGVMSWAFRFRVGGKPRKLTLGAYPAIGLKTARELAAAAATALARGEDPAATKAAAKAEARKETGADTVEAIVETFLNRYARKQTREGTARETERILKREIVGAWKGRRLAEIARADVHDLLDKIVDRGSPIAANRALAAFRRLCGWAVERGLIAFSPCEKLRAPAAEQSRDRILSDDEIRMAWKAFEKASWPFGPLAQLMLLTGARRDEVGSMAWAEIDFAARTWTIPASRSKNGMAHEVPLTDAALDILKKLPRITGEKGASNFIFTTNGQTPVSGFSKAKAAFDAAILTAMQKAATDRGEDPEQVKAPERWTLHDLRRTVASKMAALGVQPHVVEAVLNHRSGTIKGVAAVYNRYSYSAEKRDALDRWAEELKKIISV